MKKWFVLAVTVAVAFSTSASIVVRDWQFNTPGDTEGWTGQSWTVNNLKIATAQGGTESVLTCDNLQNQGDTKIYWPSDTTSLPGGATSWDKLTYRIRQIDTDGTTPQAFDDGGTIALLSPGPFGNVAPIPTATDAGATPPVTVTSQADEWLLIEWDISAYTADFNGGIRVDPVTGVDDGDPGTNIYLKNFEIDYVTLTAVPEPGVVGLLVLGGLLLLRKQRR